MNATLDSSLEDRQLSDRDPRRCDGSWKARNGSIITLRPIRPEDLALERAFVVGLSEETRYQRLLAARKLLPGELERLTRIDCDREMALIATIQTDEGEQQIGVARYVRDADAASAEFAIVIADNWQGQGLGRQLLSSLIDCAERAGIKQLVGLTFARNSGMLALARTLGFTISMVAGDGTVRQMIRTLKTGTSFA
jgi:acetyltransferase